MTHILQNDTYIADV